MQVTPCKPGTLSTSAPWINLARIPISGLAQDPDPGRLRIRYPGRSSLVDLEHENKLRGLREPRLLRQTRKLYFVTIFPP